MADSGAGPADDGPVESDDPDGGHRAVAVNVGANTNAPGFRGPVYADGSFEFVPIPESAPTAVAVPTYGDLPLSFEVPEDVRETPVHLDPAFAGYGPAERHTYGDPYGVKARPLSALAAGDRVYFYATLSRVERGGSPPWGTDSWGAYLVGRFVLDRDPVSGEEYRRLPDDERVAFAGNAHVRRETFDAAVLLHGDSDRSDLFDVAVPLSGRDAGTEPNRIVTGLSSDSGRGPWWRRPLRFDADAAARLETLLADWPASRPSLAIDG